MGTIHRLAAAELEQRSATSDPDASIAGAQERIPEGRAAQVRPIFHRFRAPFAPAVKAAALRADELMRRAPRDGLERAREGVARRAAGGVHGDDDGEPERHAEDGDAGLQGMTDRIARISPNTGEVNAWIDLSALYPASQRVPPADVLNGIAYDKATRRIYITGKKWPKLYQISVF